MKPQDKELDEELFQIIENADWIFIGRNSAEYCELKDKLLLYRNKYAKEYADKIIDTPYVDFNEIGDYDGRYDKAYEFGSYDLEDKQHELNNKLGGKIDETTK